MRSRGGAARIAVDKEAIEPMRRHYTLALNRWAYKHHISARRAVAVDENG